MCFIELHRGSMILSAVNQMRYETKPCDQTSPMTSAGSRWNHKDIINSRLHWIEKHLRFHGDIPIKAETADLEWRGLNTLVPQGARSQSQQTVPNNISCNQNIFKMAPKVLFVLSSHNKMGKLDKPTGWYLVGISSLLQAILTSSSPNSHTHTRSSLPTPKSRSLPLLAVLHHLIPLRLKPRKTTQSPRPS